MFIFLKETDVVDLKNTCVSWHVYSLDKTGPSLENEEDSEGGDVHFATHWVLPSAEFFNLWENLLYDDNIKEKVQREMLPESKLINLNEISVIELCNNDHEIRRSGNRR